MSIKHVTYLGTADASGQKPFIGVALGDPTTGALVDPAATGMTSQPVNATVAVSTTTGAIIAAAAVGIKARGTLIRNIGTRTVYLAEGEAATTSKFPLNVGETFKSESLLAINGIVAAGADGSVAVIAEAR